MYIIYFLRVNSNNTHPVYLKHGTMYNELNLSWTLALQSFNKYTVHTPEDSPWELTITESVKKFPFMEYQDSIGPYNEPALFEYSLKGSDDGV